ncbi:nuclease-related domain-containing protein [Lederbergia citri]|uniref:NERD domain-containing protein n=1 Tax=Lederbergia citri TaxID=2833580 RepID=A0A942TFX0_9BACI|nr:nuclease-related domain-containing protein [Lederbergia citri]MBS4195457.1 NERD domain-containing protein [Lederbergia citri]
MIIKALVEGNELKGYRMLCSRKLLSCEDKQQLNRLEKGYSGEVLFNERVDGLSKEWLILNDLQLESNNSEFQIDSLVISRKLLLLFEVKNYEGDYYIEGEKWYYINGNSIQNPVHQLERTEALLRRLLQDQGYNNIPIESYVIFVNPDLHLYNAPRNLPIIFPNQLNRFFERLNKIPSKTNDYHMRLAMKLLSLHKNTPPKLPNYSYEELRKGVICPNCYSYNLDSKGFVFLCESCGTIEEMPSAILRSVDEFAFLFPDRKITTRSIFEWCDGVKSVDTIRRILLKKFNLKGNGKASYYERETKNYQ